ncbi:hypothetical protein [Novipirellula artificiosorum]|uniref:hypothetical protein n=1 Tax=Novipirellula artificiosorum TaxID=2528016 RepID=UPI0011B3F76E|nr:hypothetical protein [Novipirellula artificiosorum]
MKTGFEPLVDTWLPKAERWLEQERDKPIECLLVWYMRGDSETDRKHGWDDLPKYYRSHFADGIKSWHCIKKEQEFLQIAYRGSLTGWREVFGNFDLYCRDFVRIEPSDYLDGWCSLDRWTITLFFLLQNGLISEAVGGRRMNLDPRFKVASESWTPTDTRFAVDKPMLGPLKELSDSLKDSADQYGFYAHITDLRIASVDAIRSLQKRREEHVPQTPGHANVENHHDTSPPEVDRPQKKSTRGRKPKKTLSKQEKRVREAWNTKGYETYADLDRELGEPEGTTKTILDRLRNWEKIRKQNDC